MPISREHADGQTPKDPCRSEGVSIFPMARSDLIRPLDVSRAGMLTKTDFCAPCWQRREVVRLRAEHQPRLRDLRNAESRRTNSAQPRRPAQRDHLEQQRSAPRVCSYTHTHGHTHVHRRVHRPKGTARFFPPIPREPCPDGKRRGGRSFFFDTLGSHAPNVRFEYRHAHTRAMDMPSAMPK